MWLDLTKAAALPLCHPFCQFDVFLTTDYHHYTMFSNVDYFHLWSLRKSKNKLGERMDNHWCSNCGMSENIQLTRYFVESKWKSKVAWFLTWTQNINCSSCWPAEHFHYFLDSANAQVTAILSIWRSNLWWMINWTVGNVKKLFKAGNVRDQDSWIALYSVTYLIQPLKEADKFSILSGLACCLHTLPGFSIALVSLRAPCSP